MPVTKGRRLDLVVVERGLAETRARAQAIIVGGHVKVNGVVATKPSALVDAGAKVELVHPSPGYVGRGALKLEHALQSFQVTVAGVVAADVGASTGGFTDVLLRHGASRVYAMDVGYGQLAWTLRNDPRVVVMERTNIRHVTSLPEPLGLAVIDVSFISLRLVLPVVRSLLGPTGQVIALIKPQFEVGRGQTKKGVVRDDAVRMAAVRSVLTTARDEGWAVRGLVRSPVLGPAGNVEYLALLGLQPPGSDVEQLLSSVS